MRGLIPGRFAVNPIQLQLRIRRKIGFSLAFGIQFRFYLRVFLQELGSRIFKNIIGKIFLLHQDGLKEIPGKPGIRRLGFQRFHQIAIGILIGKYNVVAFVELALEHFFVNLHRAVVIMTFPGISGFKVANNVSPTSTSTSALSLQMAT